LETGRPPQGPWGEDSSVVRGMGYSRLKWAEARRGRRSERQRWQSMLLIGLVWWRE
jgi:hypothetical protein